MRTPASTFAALFALTAFAALPGVAQADPSAAAVEEGRARFTKGVSLFRTNDFRARIVVVAVSASTPVGVRAPTPSTNASARSVILASIRCGSRR